MKFVKRILFLLLFLMVIGLVIALFLPKDIRVERSMTINAPAASVYNQVNTLKNWENWSPWVRMDPEMKTSYTGVTSGKGATYSWTGPEVGSGSLTISDSFPFSNIKTNLTFDQGGGNGTWTFVDKGDQTEVTWAMDTHMSWPSNLMGLMMDGMLGPTFEDGLKNIDEHLSK